MPAVRFPVEPEVTMETVLRLPALRRGAPELLAGSERLGTPVRWAHSCEARHIAGLLEGGELLLMTGMGLRSAAADQRAFVRELVEHRVAGLVIELGRVFTELPEPLVAEARRTGLPLVALRDEVRFVEVTEQLHTALLGRRTLAQARVAELSDALLRALLDGAGVEALLGLLAGAVGNPAVLERTGGEVVFHAAHHSDAGDLLAHLRLLEDAPIGHENGIDRASHGGFGSREPAAGDRLATAPVLRPGGAVWGRLVVPPHEREVDSLTRLAVERTAPLVALALRRAGEEAQLRSRERGNFLHDLVTGAVAGADAAARATELGGGPTWAAAAGVHGRGAVPARVTAGRDGAAAAHPQTTVGEDGAGRVAEPRLPDGVRLLPVAAAWRTAVDEERRADVVRVARRRLRERGLAGLVGTRAAEDDALAVVTLPPGMDRPGAATAVAEILSGADAGPATREHQSPVTVAVGPVAHDWDEVAVGLRTAIQAAHTMRDATPVAWHDATEADVGRLLWGLREDPQVTAFARQRLRPVLEHDRVRSAALLPTLRALSESHWHKAQAARALGIQRQSLYARMERLGGLLESDLDDPAVRLGLDLAVRAQTAAGAG